MRSFLILLIASAFASCSTGPRLGRIETCVTDPENNVVHCDGNTKRFRDTKRMICFPLDQFEEYFEGCE